MDKSAAEESRDFDRIVKWLTAESRLVKMGKAIRSAIDFVIDGARTGRFSVDELQTSEKIYIGRRRSHHGLL